MTRTSTLDEVGNLNAPPGSRDWAVAVCLDIQSTLNDVKGDAEHLDVMIALIREHKGYRQLKDRRGRPFATYEAFCIEKQPFGLGYRTDDIDRIIGERRARTTAETAETPLKLLDDRGPATKEEQASIPSERRNTSYGETTNYLTARIARDRPDILERMKAGEFPSVRKAALEAGFVRPTITLPLDPDAAVRLIVKHFKGEALEALVRGLVNWSGIDVANEQDPPC
jgi:hypothetical protein